MSPFTTIVVRTILSCALLATPVLVRAADTTSYNSAMCYVSLDVQSDSENARQLSATGSFTLGNNLWLQGSIGELTEGNSSTQGNTPGAALGDLRQLGFGGGLSGEHLQLSVNFNDYQSDSTYQQRDLNATLDWMTDDFMIGVDLMNRHTDNSLDTVRDFPTLGLSNVALHVDESLTGNGFGAHAAFNITDKLNVSLGGMSYSYDSDYELTSSTNPVLIRRLLAKHPTLSRLVYLGSSGVTRSLALLDNSYHLGLSYQFSTSALSASYFHDKALDSDTTSQTVLLSASVFAGEHWMLAPMLGASSSDQSDNVTFGGLSISYNW